MPHNYLLIIDMCQKYHKVDLIQSDYRKYTSEGVRSQESGEHMQCDSMGKAWIHGSSCVCMLQHSNRHIYGQQQGSLHKCTSIRV